MEANRKQFLLLLALQIREQIADISLSDSDSEEFAMLETALRTRRKISRVPYYVETIVPTMINQDFKSHFRYQMFFINISISIQISNRYLKYSMV